MYVKIKKFSNDVITPHKAHIEDGCFDIHAFCKVDNDDVVFSIPPHETVKISTGFATEIPNSYCALVFPRSGLSTKQSLALINAVAVIDANYRGEWMIPIHNYSNEYQYIRSGDRIAQFMVVPVLDTQLVEVNELSDTNRGDGGFGSSGK